MNTPSPISNVSGCWKPTPMPIRDAVAEAAGQRAPDGTAHHRVDVALAAGVSGA